MNFLQWDFFTQSTILRFWNYKIKYLNSCHQATQVFNLSTTYTIFGIKKRKKCFTSSSLELIYIYINNDIKKKYMW
jgi:hypothetical protein